MILTILELKLLSFLYCLKMSQTQKCQFSEQNWNSWIHNSEKLNHLAHLRATSLDPWKYPVPDRGPLPLVSLWTYRSVHYNILSEMEIAHCDTYLFCVFLKFKAFKLWMVNFIQHIKKKGVDCIMIWQMNKSRKW